MMPAVSCLANTWHCHVQVSGATCVSCSSHILGATNASLSSTSLGCMHIPKRLDRQLSGMAVAHTCMIVNALSAELTSAVLEGDMPIMPVTGVSINQVKDVVGRDDKPLLQLMKDKQAAAAAAVAAVVPAAAAAGRVIGGERRQQCSWQQGSLDTQLCSLLLAAACWAAHKTITCSTWNSPRQRSWCCDPTSVKAT